MFRRIPFMFAVLFAVFLAAAGLENEAGASVLAPALRLDGDLLPGFGTGPAVEEPPPEKSLAIAVTLAIIPGFGIGHFYAGDMVKGYTFLAVDIFLTTTVVVNCSLALTTIVNFSGFFKVAVIALPIILLVERGVEGWSASKSVEVENNRYFRSAVPTEAGTFVPMTTVARF